MASDDDIKTYSSKDVTTKVRVLSKPEATYTEEARRNQISGTIVVRCVFGANGKVFGIRPISSLAGGLTENAIRAARGITFIPATKDGRPVSVWMEVVYNFNIY
jgi:TonB family protein